MQAVDHVSMRVRLACIVQHSHMSLFRLYCPTFTRPHKQSVLSSHFFLKTNVKHVYPINKAKCDVHICMHNQPSWHESMHPYTYILFSIQMDVF